MWSSSRTHCYTLDDQLLCLGDGFDLGFQEAGSYSVALPCLGKMMPLSKTRPG